MTTLCYSGTSTVDTLKNKTGAQFSSLSDASLAVCGHIGITSTIIYLSKEVDKRDGKRTNAYYLSSYIEWLIALDIHIC